MNTKIQLSEMRGKARRINTRLVNAAPLFTPLKLSDITLQCISLHVGPGIYEPKSCSSVHRHSELQLEYVIDGEFQFIVDGKKSLLKSGSGLFITAGTLHSWVCIRGGLMLGAIIKTSGHGQDELLLRLNRTYSTRKQGFTSLRTEQIVSVLISRLLTQSRIPWQNEEISAMVNLWFLECCRAQLKSMKWQPNLNNTNQHNQINRNKAIAIKIMDFIEDNYAHPLNRNSIAHQVGICARHADRVFHQVYSESITNAITRIRLNRAIEILQNDLECPIKAVAYAAGFSSSSYFNKCFYKSFSMKPTEIRQQKTKK